MPRGGFRQGAGRKKKVSGKLVSTHEIPNGQIKSALNLPESSPHGYQNPINVQPGEPVPTDHRESHSLDTGRSSEHSKENERVNDSKGSNQNEPKTLIQKESENYGETPIPEGQQSRSLEQEQDGEETGTDGRRELPSQSGLGDVGDRLRSITEARNNVEGVLGNAIHSARTGNSDQDGNQDHGDTHAESPAGHSGQHSEQSEQPDDDRSDADGSISADQESTAIAKLRDPAVYCSLYCHDGGKDGIRYVPKQLEFLRACQIVEPDGTIDLSKYPRDISVAAVNEFGKTMLIADLIRYFLDWIPGCVVGFTSHVARQCEMLESYFKRQQMLPRFKDSWKCVEGKLHHPTNGNWARWFTAKDVGAVESLHAPKFMIAIADEVKSMDPDIVAALSRWKPKLTIFVSSKGLSMGPFYDSLTSKRHLYQTVEASAMDCPWISQQSIDRDIEKHGRNSAIIKSMIFNEWSDYGVRNLITIEQIQRCYSNPPNWRNPGFRSAGLDLSAAKKGGDRMVGVVRQGNKLFQPYFVPECQSEMEAIGLVVRWLKAEQVKYLNVDNGGMGAPMIARLREVIGNDPSISINAVNFGAAPLDPVTMNRNRVTELWSNGANKIEMRELIFEWNQRTKDEFIAEVSGRAVEPVDSSGVIKLTAKDKLRAQGYKSPDLADATFLCLIEPAHERQSVTGLGKDKNWASFKDPDSTGSGRFGMSSSGRKFGRG